MSDHNVNPEDYAPPEGSYEKDLYDAIHLGVAAQKFLESDLATHICETAEAKVILAQNKLSVVNPSDTKEIIRLQTEITKFAHFVESLRDLVAAGDSAYQQYQHQLSND